jgi:hypothetical protein
VTSILRIILTGVAGLTLAAGIWSTTTPFFWAAVGWLTCAVVIEAEELFR